MDTYHIWFDLKESARDLAFHEALEGFLGHLREAGTIEGHRLQRRKLGFGPDTLGEFHLMIDVKDLSQLDAAFGAVAPRAQPTEGLHAAVWSQVTNFRSGLWRDFPDAVRARATHPR